VFQRIGTNVPLLLLGRSSDQKSTSSSRSLMTSVADTRLRPFANVTIEERSSIGCHVRRGSARAPGAMRHRSLRTVTVSASLIPSPRWSTTFTSDASRTWNVAASSR
jgi:hypothetical protein